MISLLEPFKLALQSLLSNKFRSILTTLGVIIGVAAVITLVSMGEGAKSYILNQIGSCGVGSNSITVQPGTGDAAVPELTLTYEDAQTLRQKLRNLQYLMPEFVGRGRLLYGRKSYNPAFTLGVSADYPFAYKQMAVEDIKKILIARHRKEDFHIHTQQGIIDIVNNILNAMTGIVSAIAAISLLVGGIGIMNIMLVAVTERVREIGVRKAIGTKRRDIIYQFLMESMLISLIGGMLGIFFGLLGAFLIMWAIKGTLVIAWWAVIMATTVSALVGIFFGVYPAVRAASLDPVIALRYE